MLMLCFPPDPVSVCRLDPTLLDADGAVSHLYSYSTTILADRRERPRWSSLPINKPRLPLTNLMVP